MRREDKFYIHDIEKERRDILTERKKKFEMTES